MACVAKKIDCYIAQSAYARCGEKRMLMQSQNHGVGARTKRNQAIGFSAVQSPPSAELSGASAQRRGYKERERTITPT